MQVRDAGGLDQGGGSGHGEEVAYRSVLEIELVGLLDDLDMTYYRRGKNERYLCVSVCVHLYVCIPELMAGPFTSALREMVIGWTKREKTAGVQGRRQILQALSSHIKVSGFYPGMMGRESVRDLEGGQWHNQIHTLEICLRLLCGWSTWLRCHLHSPELSSLPSKLLSLR